VIITSNKMVVNACKTFLLTLQTHL
jgi:hypothetical protein